MSRISIVIPNLNYGRYLNDAILSVLNQDYGNLELIIVDGGSTDNSLDVIRRHRSSLAAVIVEPDTGQANAINKGLALATGEIFNWLNSDDMLFPNALATVATEMAGSDCLAGACIHVDENLVELRRLGQSGLTARRLICGAIGTVFQQPAFWVRREPLLACGGLNETLHFAFDLEMAIRYLGSFPRVHYSNSNLALFRHHEVSKTEGSPAAFVREEMELLSLLSAKSDFQYRRLAKHWLERRRWWSFLDTLSDCTRTSRSARFFRILVGAMAAPRVRIGRATFRALRNCLSPMDRRTTNQNL